MEDRERVAADRKRAASTASSRVQDATGEALDAIAMARAIRSGLAAGGADVAYLDAIETALRAAIADCGYSYRVSA
jgi:hypothetical protein